MRADPLAELFSLLHRKGSLTDEHVAALRTAYAIAEVAHAGQKRKSGDPYITHPVHVAEIASGWDFPFALLPAALLHDVTDPNCAVVPQGGMQSLRGRVDEDVIAILHIQTRLQSHGDAFALLTSPPPTPPTSSLTPESLALSAVALRIADRLHNARTWEYLEAPRARLRAQQTLDLIAPVAATACLPEARDELLKLSRRTLRRTRQAGSPTTRGEGMRHRSGEHLTHALLHRALDSLPERLRHRYAEEWSADLAVLQGARQRMQFAAGLQYSARKLAGG